MKNYYLFSSIGDDRELIAKEIGRMHDGRIVITTTRGESGLRAAAASQLTRLPKRHVAYAAKHFGDVPELSAAPITPSQG
jgi:hypothetical protein